MCACVCVTEIAHIDVYRKLFFHIVNLVEQCVQILLFIKIKKFMKYFRLVLFRFWGDVEMRKLGFFWHDRRQIRLRGDFGGVRMVSGNTVVGNSLPCRGGIKACFYPDASFNFRLEMGTNFHIYIEILEELFMGKIYK